MFFLSYFVSCFVSKRVDFMFMVFHSAIVHMHERRIGLVCVSAHFCGIYLFSFLVKFLAHYSMLSQLEIPCRRACVCAHCACTAFAWTRDMICKRSWFSFWIDLFLFGIGAHAASQANVLCSLFGERCFLHLIFTRARTSRSHVHFFLSGSCVPFFPLHFIVVRLVWICAAYSRRWHCLLSSFAYTRWFFDLVSSKVITYSHIVWHFTIDQSILLFINFMIFIFFLSPKHFHLVAFFCTADIIQCEIAHCTLCLKYRREGKNELRSANASTRFTV